MRWNNHQATTMMLVYAGTGNIVATALSWFGSAFPDLIEFPFGKKTQHRTWSHWPYTYISVFIVLWVWTLLGDSLTPEYINYFIIGCLLHLATDALSPHGIPFGKTPWTKRRGLGWYRPFQQSEYLLSVTIVVVGFVVAMNRGFFSAEYFALEMKRAYLVIQWFSWSWQ